VTSNLTDDYLQQLDSNEMISSKPVSHSDNHKNINQSPQLLANEKVSFARFSEQEIQRFESFFDTYVKQPLPQVESKIETDLEVEQVQEIDFSDIIPNHNESEVLQLEEDLIEQFKLDKPPVNLDEANEDDLIALEELLYTSYLDDVDSLDNLFAEITDNEKDSISNYESSVFNANIQSIFDDDNHDMEEILLVDDHDSEFLDLPPAPDSLIDEQLVFDFDLPTPPSSIIPAEVLVDELPDEIAALDFVLPAVPLSNESEAMDVDEQSLLTPIDVANTFFEQEEEYLNIENESIATLQTQKKKKKFTLHLVDTILILVIIVILFLLIINLSDVLPIDLPFL